MAGDGVQATDLKRVGKAVPKIYVHKDGKTIMIPAEKKDEYMAKGYKLSSLRAEGVMSSYGQYLEMEFKRQNKYKDIHDFEASPEFQALIQQHPVFKDKEQTGVKEDQTTNDVKAILDKHGIKSTDDIEYGSDAFSDLFDYFSSDPDEMPYGVQKARTGMPDEWIADRLIDLGLLDEDQSGKEGFEYPEGGKYGYKAERGSGTGAMGTMQVNVTLHNKETDEIMDIKDMHYLELEKGEGQETLAMIWDENKDLIKKEDDTSSKGMNKYGLAAVNKDGKFYSYRNGKLTGTFDNMKDLQKHQHDLIKNEDLAQMAHKVEQDHEVQMARSDLYKAAKYSIKLHDRLKNISEEEGLEGWVAAKITKASDYLSSVYHYMDYEMMSEETYLQEGWADDLRKLGARGLDKMKALYDPATAAKVKADDTAGADANTMFKDLTTVHAMNQQDMTKGYDNNTILGYMKKYIEPRNPKAFLDLSKSATPLRKIFPVGQKTTKQTLMTQLQKVAQTMAKVDLPGVRGRPPATQGAESIDYKESMHKRFEKKLAESKKKPVLEDFIGKPITEEEFEKLAEKKDACYHKVRSRYKVWPSAYASGALVQCRKKGAANWGNKSKK